MQISSCLNPGNRTNSRNSQACSCPAKQASTFYCSCIIVTHQRVTRYLLLLLFSIQGCSTLGSRQQQVQDLHNPLLLTAAGENVAWEQTIGVLHDFLFEIERENRQTRSIETKYKVGSGLLEPWHTESVGWDNRLESTLQSIRRKVVVTLSPVSQGSRYSYTVQVVAIKELEDLDALAANSPGGATFQESTPLNRDLNQVLGQSRPSGWIPQGRDYELEQAILVQLQKLSAGNPHQQ